MAPRIKIMGEHGMEEVSWDELPEAGPVELDDYFKPVKLSPKAIDQASKIVPKEVWTKPPYTGLHSWLQAAADQVFQKKLPADKTEVLWGKLRYKYRYDADGPVLDSIRL